MAPSRKATSTGAGLDPSALDAAQRFLKAVHRLAQKDRQRVARDRQRFAGKVGWGSPVASQPATTLDRPRASEAETVLPADDFDALVRWVDEPAKGTPRLRKQAHQAPRATIK
jgi:hypothetical protein